MTLQDRIDEIRETLTELRAQFEPEVDIAWDGVPNREMALVMACDDALRHLFVVESHARRSQA